MVTLAIPIYNGSLYLKECLQSVVNQTFSDLEILIVDDNSTDDSFEIINTFLDDKRIKYYKNTKNLGLVENWNTCIKLSQGEFIQFVFQDDILELNCVEILHNNLIESKSSFVLCDRKYFFEDEVDAETKTFYLNLKKLSHLIDRSRKVEINESWCYFEKYFIKFNYLGEPNVGMFKKELIANYGGFDKNLKQIVDFEFWLRLSLQEPFFFIKKELIHFRISSHSQSSKNSKVEKLWLYDRLNWLNKICTDANYDHIRKIHNIKKCTNFQDKKRAYIDFVLSIFSIKKGFIFLKREKKTLSILPTYLSYLLLKIRVKFFNYRPYHNLL